MLEFYRGVAADLDNQLKLEISKLIAADGEARSNIIRGRISGLNEAMDVLKRQLKKMGENGDSFADAVLPQVVPIQPISAAVQNARAYRRGQR